MNLYPKLQQRAAQNEPVRIGLIGAGKFGSMYLAQIPRTPGVHLVGKHKAVNGLEAQRLWSKNLDRIDLLMTDVIMPGVSGVELAAQVCQRRPGIPVLFVSGYDEESLQQRGVDLASAELIVKPFDYPRLTATVRRMLDQALDKQPAGV